MKKNLLDLSTDILKERITSAQAILAQEFKGSNPYRQKPVDNKERLLTFSQFTPEQIREARAAFGDDAMDSYLVQIATLMRRRKHA